MSDAPPGSRVAPDDSNTEVVDLARGMIEKLLAYGRSSAGPSAPPLAPRSTLQRLGSGLAADSPTSAAITSKQIATVLKRVKAILLAQPMLLEVQAPIKLVGDIHGQFKDLIRIFEKCGYPDQHSYLFLGDYVDRGPSGLEVTLLLLCYKVIRKDGFFLLRGNHECAAINRIYGFYDECKRAYGLKVWKQFNDVFNCLPVAAIVDDKIFCVHGGLSPSLRSKQQITEHRRPCDVPDVGLICDFLWADPDACTQGWAESERGVSYTFGSDVVSKFLEDHDFDLMVRAHQVVEDGYEFFAQRQLVTLFSAPNYCGEFDNSGAVMSVDASLMCSFHILKPRSAAPGTPDTVGRGGR